MKTYLRLKKQRLTGSKQELAEICASTDEDPPEEGKGGPGKCGCCEGLAVID
jgi:hypothetical protein